MRTKILITVRGGQIQTIAATSENIEIYVADYDNVMEGNNGNLFQYYNAQADETISEKEFKEKIREKEKEYPEPEEEPCPKPKLMTSRVRAAMRTEPNGDKYVDD